MKKTVALVLASCMAVSLCACSGSSATTTTAATSAAADNSAATADSGSSGGNPETHDPETVTIGTASSSGVFYAVAAGISNTLSQHSDFLSLMVQATSGGTENTELVSQGELEFGFSTTSYGVCASTDTGFTAGGGVKNIAGVMSLYSSYYHMLVRADAGIDDFGDFKDSGLTVCLGNMAAEHDAISQELLKAYDLEVDKDIKAVYLSQDEACEKLGDGDIDATMIMTGAPAALFTNLTIDDKFKLVNFDADILAQLTAEDGALNYEIQTVIPAGTYNNEEDINAICSKALIFCQPDLDDAIVYEFCKQFYENFDEVQASHSALSEVDLTTIAETGVALHPGAEAYYREIGLIN